MQNEWSSCCKASLITVIREAKQYSAVGAVFCCWKKSARHLEQELGNEREPCSCVTGVVYSVTKCSSFHRDMWVQSFGTCILVKPQLLLLRARMEKQEAKKGGSFIFYYIKSLWSEVFWFWWKKCSSFVYCCPQIQKTKQ